ncbi:MAG: hypothetical protein V2G48_02760 [bacterium JZ-2024 1]
MTDWRIFPAGYIPICTTVVSSVFGCVLFKRYVQRGRAPYLGWWTSGVFIYALGTFTESLVTLFGWNPYFFRLWYISGALMGGAPLAQGSVYFHLPRRVGNILTLFLVVYLMIAITLVMLSPLELEKVEMHRLSGAVFSWRWVRWFSPPVNLYALIFLAGGAFYSAFTYLRRRNSLEGFLGNTFIAVGALLPGIGGVFTRLGYTEVLYVMELFGILLIWAGYRLIIQWKDMQERSKMTAEGKNA